MLGAVLGCLLLGTPAVSSAGFLSDFAKDAGTQSQVTEAGLYESSSMDIVTGGRYVVKVPRRQFQPFYLQAPELKAGCGGIDMFLGAFSVPSKEEFLSFLRSIGTALPGLAFQMALQSLAPDLNEQVSQFRDMLMRMSSELGDNCRTAQTILDASGASGWINGMGERARSALRTNGTAEDQSDAVSMTRANGSNVLSNVPERTDTGGTVIEASELNLTWALLKSGKRANTMTTDQLELMMTLTGSVIYSRTGSGAAETVEERRLPAADLVDALLGTDTAASTVTVQTWHCDEALKCLNPTLRDTIDANLAASIYEAMERYRKSISTRNPAAVSENDLRLLTGISSLPLLRLSELAASPRLAGFSASFLTTYAQAAAYEAVLNVLSGLAADIKENITGSTAATANAVTLEHAKALEERLSELSADLRRRETVLLQRMSRVALFIDETRHLTRAIYGEAAADALPSVTLPH